MELVKFNFLRSNNIQLIVLDNRFLGRIIGKSVKKNLRYGDFFFQEPKVSFFLSPNLSNKT